MNILATIHYPVDVLADDYAWMIIVAIISLAFAIMLRSPLLVVVEAILGGALFSTLATTPVLLYIMMGLQIIFGLYLTYLIFRRIDRNYRLVLEKTHQAPKDLTQNSYTGLK